MTPLPRISTPHRSVVMRTTAARHGSSSTTAQPRSVQPSGDWVDPGIGRDRGDGARDTGVIDHQVAMSTPSTGPTTTSPATGSDDPDVRPPRTPAV